jgi:hypothetical protein
MDFQNGGIRGLIAKSYFKTIVAPHGVREFGGQTFDAYELFDRDDQFAYWRPDTLTMAVGEVQNNGVGEKGGR